MGTSQCNAIFINDYYKQWQSICAVFYHELAHCSKLGHKEGEQPPDPKIKVPRTLDFIYKLGCCMCVVTKGHGKCGPECDRVGNKW